MRDEKAVVMEDIERARERIERASERERERERERDKAKQVDKHDMPRHAKTHTLSRTVCACFSVSPRRFALLRRGLLLPLSLLACLLACLLAS